MTHYNDVTVRLNGEPLCTAESVTVSEAPDADESLPPFRATFQCTTDLSAVAVMFDTVRLPPSQPRGYVTIPYGILGPIRLGGVVDAAACSFQMAENEVRRAMSMAVQRAIVNRGWRADVCSKAIFGAKPALAEMGAHVLRKRSARKQRKAMRRLLRAAGILGGGQ